MGSLLSRQTFPSTLQLGVQSAANNDFHAPQPSRALSQDRLRLGARIGDRRQFLVNFLSSPKEGTGKVQGCVDL